jgi:hypothetical protein
MVIGQHMRKFWTAPWAGHAWLVVTMLPACLLPSGGPFPRRNGTCTQSAICTLWWQEPTPYVLGALLVMTADGQRSIWSGGEHERMMR